MATYAFCETVAAYLWHIRELSSEGLKLSGGADTLTLCGVKPSWDIKCEIRETSLTSGRLGAGKCCPECVKAYNDRSPGKEGP
jgi:hypothetical protein